MPSSTAFKASANTKTPCGCGGSYSKSNKAGHLKTKKCLAFQTTQTPHALKLAALKQKARDLIDPDWDLFLRFNAHPKYTGQQTDAEIDAANEIFDQELDKQDRFSPHMTDNECYTYEKEVAIIHYKTIDILKDYHIKTYADEIIEYEAMKKKRNLDNAFNLDIPYYSDVRLALSKVDPSEHYNYLRQKKDKTWTEKDYLDVLRMMRQHASREQQYDELRAQATDFKFDNSRNDYNITDAT